MSIRVYELRLLQQALESGKVLLLLCDTVYGLVAKAPEGCTTLQQIKGRPEGKAFLQLYGSLEQLQQSPWQLPPESLLRHWPGPLTCILGPKPEAGGSADGSQAVRIPRHELLQRLCLEMACPLYSTSANRSGAATATQAEQLQKIFAKEIAAQQIIPYFPEQQPSRDLVASTLVDARLSPPKILRRGTLNLH